MVRCCARPICAEVAATTLSYDYASSTVWIDHLTVEAHPMTHDLCLEHADRMVVPQGWELQDRRAVLRRIA